MKKILITGEKSYIGTSFEKWVGRWEDQYVIGTIDMKSDQWKQYSFDSYDVVYHVAAIVHVKESNIANYYRVNRDLSLEVAKKAKKDKVKQFIFLSTMGVYGTEIGRITQDTKPAPKTHYAKSKLEGEGLLQELETEDFHVTIIRPPIVYGRDCSGNYSRLAKMALKMPVFPVIKNERSMIYIDNLSEFVRLVIENQVGGILFPQNKEYVNISELVFCIAKAHGKSMRKTRLINWGVYLGIEISETCRKVFGSFVYEKNMPGGPGTIMEGHIFDYNVFSLMESIEYSEKY